MRPAAGGTGGHGVPAQRQGGRAESDAPGAHPQPGVPADPASPAPLAQLCSVEQQQQDTGYLRRVQQDPNWHGHRRETEGHALSAGDELAHQASGGRQRPPRPSDSEQNWRRVRHLRISMRAEPAWAADLHQHWRAQQGAAAGTSSADEAEEGARWTSGVAEGGAPPASE